MVTQVSGLIECVSIYYEENLNTVIPIHHFLTIQSSFIKKQRASMDTCLLPNGQSYHFLWSICWLLSGAITIHHPPSQFRQALYYKELPQTLVCDCSLQANGSVIEMMLNFFIVLTSSVKPKTWVTHSVLTEKFLQWMHTGENIGGERIVEGSEVMWVREGKGD